MTYYWAQVANGDDVVGTTTHLPAAIAELSAADQVAAGWYPMTNAPPTFDPDTQYVAYGGYTINGDDTVTQDVQVVDYDAPTVALRLQDAIAVALNTCDQVAGNHLLQGFDFDGKHYQSDPASVQRLGNAAVAALAAVVSGVGAAGNLRWANTEEDFAWIAADNSLTSMDAPTMLSFYSTAIAIGQSVILYNRQLKNEVLAASNFTDLRSIDVTAGWPN